MDIFPADKRISNPDNPTDAHLLSVYSKDLILIVLIEAIRHTSCTLLLGFFAIVVRSWL